MPISADSSRYSVEIFNRLPFNICFIYLADLIDLIVEVLMPLYTHLYNLKADSFIGGNRLPSKKPPSFDE